MKTLSLIIPCYGEEETIRPFLEETQKVEKELSTELLFEYIFVNDGSKDNTLSVLRDVSKKYINVHYLSLSRNFGKESALLAGLEEARGDYITVMDADLQTLQNYSVKCMQKFKKVTMLLEPAERIEKGNHH